MRDRSLQYALVFLALLTFYSSKSQDIGLSLDSVESAQRKTDSEYEMLILQSERALRDVRTNADILDDLFKPIVEQTKIKRKQLERAAQYERAEFILMGLILVVIGITVTLIIQLIQIRKRSYDQFKSEKMISSLLMEILPKSIVEKIVGNSKVDPSIWSDCLVIFIEVVHKEEYSTVDERMVAVNASFRVIEKQLDKHGLIKIKSSGDKILAVHKINTVTSQQQLQNTLEALGKIKRALAAVKDFELDFRSGIDTGDVISALVGQKKLQFDIWGSAVNDAFLLVDHAQAGQILCSSNIAAQAASARIDYRSLSAPLNGKNKEMKFFEILC